MNSKKSAASGKKNGQTTKSKAKVAAKSRANVAADASIKSAPAEKRTAPKAKQTDGSVGKPSKRITKIQAQVNVGFGNTLYIRGDGAGLSWESGVPLTCVNDSLWAWQTDRVDSDLNFKLLLNDQVWCQGDDLKVSAGDEVAAVPAF